MRKHLLGLVSIACALLALPVIGEHVNENSRFQVLGVCILASILVGAVIFWCYSALIAGVKWIMGHD